MINFKKENSFFESQAHSDTNNKQQQFPDKLYSQKATCQQNIGKKAINTVKSQQRTAYRQQGKQIIFTNTEGQTNKL